MAWSDLPGLATILDLLCPPRCGFCGADVAEGRPGGGLSCEPCATAFSRDVTRCGLCGEPAEGDVGCRRCRGRRRDWDGLAVLKKFDGMRAEAVGVSAVNFGTVFGITAEPQAMSDRWGAIAAGTYTGLADFINATVAASSVL